MTVEQATATVDAGAQVATGSPRPATGRANFLQVVRVIWMREVLIYFRDRPRMISAFIMPILMLVMFGEGLGNSIATLPGDIGYRQFIFPGMVAMIVLMNSVFSGVSIVTDRQFGFLREILVAPVSRTAICIGKITGGATISLVNGVVMFVMAPILGIDITLEIVAKLIGLIALVSFMLTGLGVAMGSRLRSVESFQMLSQVAIMPAMFLSGIFFPINNVPAWMDVIVKLNPVTYAVAPIREIALSEQLKALPADAPFQITHVDWFGYTLSTWEELGVVFVFGAVMLTIAIRAIRTTE
ncbi:MAG: ABC transporter permease subunit [Dehalococcoidia bacterium]|nr:ABC transporter permease [Chloroflexota bacterium]MXX20069.1 ABC transporter permease subunit [Dehalococcoidia bacterium]MYD29835.1 ABC transporter permease subunit [Dehalococcoidia bacterium]